MPRPKSFEPKYRHHKSSGQAYVVIDGKDVWLGEYGSKASRDKYHTVLSEWIARDRVGLPVVTNPAGGPTITMLLAAYLRHANSYYAKVDGLPVAVNHLRQVMRLMKRLYGATPAAEFGPLTLKAVRQAMLQPRRETDPITGKSVERPGWSRNYTSQQVGRIKAMFKWAVENELVPPGVFQGLQAVTGLRKGKTEARETEPVMPAPEELIDPVRDLVSPQVRAMIDLQLLTGARPGELCRMRSCDVDAAPAVWVYRPESHKTAHHGHRREIFIGPKAQRVLRPLLKPDLQACTVDTAFEGPDEAVLQVTRALCVDLALAPWGRRGGLAGGPPNRAGGPGRRRGGGRGPGRGRLARLHGRRRAERGGRGRGRPGGGVVGRRARGLGAAGGRADARCP
jgi:integrase